jgi:hypothetical protein
LIVGTRVRHTGLQEASARPVLSVAGSMIYGGVSLSRGKPLVVLLTSFFALIAVIGIGLASTFRYLAPPSLQIRTATYGGNCGAPASNATRDVALICNGRQNCSYLVDVERSSPPA